MSRTVAASILAVGTLVATILLCAFWAIGFEAATFQGRRTPASVASVESAATVAGLLFISIVSALALVLERQFRRLPHAILTIVRWMGLTVALGCACVALGLAVIQFGDHRALTLSIDAAVDIVRRVARYF